MTQWLSSTLVLARFNDHTPVCIHVDVYQKDFQGYRGEVLRLLKIVNVANRKCKTGFARCTTFFSIM